MGERTAGTWHAAQVVEGDTWVERETERGFAPIAQVLLPPGRGWDTGAATRTEMLANARLMAAAPDLLAACEAADALITQLATVAYNDEAADYFPCGLVERTKEWIGNNPAWAAIQKARGEVPS